MDAMLCTHRLVMARELLHFARFQLIDTRAPQLWNNINLFFSISRLKTQISQIDYGFTYLRPAVVPNHR